MVIHAYKSNWPADLKVTPPAPGQSTECCVNTKLPKPLENSVINNIGFIVVF